MKTAELIYRTGSAYGTTCKVFGCDRTFPNWESAIDYAKRNKQQLEAKWEQEKQVSESLDREQWIAETKIAIARLLTKAGHKLEDVWNFIRDMDDETLARTRQVAEIAPTALIIK